MPEIAGLKPYSLPGVRYVAPQTGTFTPTPIVAPTGGASVLQGSAATMNMAAETIAKLPELLAKAEQRGRTTAQAREAHKYKMGKLKEGGKALEDFTFGGDDTVSYKPVDPLLRDIDLRNKLATLNYHAALTEKTRTGSAANRSPIAIARGRGAGTSGSGASAPYTYLNEAGQLVTTEGGGPVSQGTDDLGLPALGPAPELGAPAAPGTTPGTTPSAAMGAPMAPGTSATNRKAIEAADAARAAAAAAEAAKVAAPPTQPTGPAGGATQNAAEAQAMTETPEGRAALAEIGKTSQMMSGGLAALGGGVPLPMPESVTMTTTEPPPQVAPGPALAAPAPAAGPPPTEIAPPAIEIPQVAAKPDGIYYASDGADIDEVPERPNEGLVRTRNGKVVAEMWPGDTHWKDVKTEKLSTEQTKELTALLKRGIPIERAKAMSEEEKATILAHPEPLTPAEKLAAKRDIRTNYQDMPSTVSLFGKGQLMGVDQIKTKLDEILARNGGKFENITNKQEQRSFIFQMNKLNDPGSAVLSGEYKSAADTLGFLERIKQLWGKVEAGEQATPAQLQEIYTVVTNFHDGIKKDYVADLQSTVEEAKELGVAPSRVGVPSKALEWLKENQQAGATSTATAATPPALSGVAADDARATAIEAALTSGMWEGKPISDDQRARATFALEALKKKIAAARAGKS